MLKAKIKKNEDGHSRTVKISVAGNIQEITEDVCILVENLGKEIKKSAGTTEAAVFKTMVAQHLFDVPDDKMKEIIEKSIEDAKRKTKDEE